MIVSDLVSIAAGTSDMHAAPGGITFVITGDQRGGQLPTGSEADPRPSSPPPSPSDAPILASDARLELDALTALFFEDPDRGLLKGG